MPDAAHIGIVACSAEGAALCYRTICTEGAAVLGPYRHPEVSMHTHPLASYVDRIEAGDWKGVADLMLDCEQTGEQRRGFSDLSRQYDSSSVRLRRAALTAAVAAHR
jgi:hypothetical protein